MQVSRRALLQSRRHGPPGPASMILAPFVRFEDAGLTLKLLGAALASFQFVWNNFFLGAVTLLLMASAVDWTWGRSLARARGDFDARLSEWGWQTKAAGVALAAFIRVVEDRAAFHQVFETHGWLGAAIAMTLLLREIASIDSKRRSIGGPSIPVLTAFLDYGERTLAAMTPTHLKEPKVGRRAGDQEP